MTIAFFEASCGVVVRASAAATLQVSSGFVCRVNRQNELEQRSVFAVRRSRKPTAVILDNCAAYGQSQTHAMRLRRNEGVKHLVDFCRINSGPGILHRYGNGIGITPLGFQQQPSTLPRCGGHCFNCVVDQVIEDLLQLTPIAADKWHRSCQFSKSRDAALAQLSAQSM